MKYLLGFILLLQLVASVQLSRQAWLLRERERLLTTANAQLQFCIDQMHRAHHQLVSTNHP